jgi:hypothetical protein
MRLCAVPLWMLSQRFGTHRTRHVNFRESIPPFVLQMWSSIVRVLEAAGPGLITSRAKGDRLRRLDEAGPMAG